MKKILFVIALISVVLLCLAIAGANQEIRAIQNDQIKVSLNGAIQEFKDETTGERQFPITYNDRTYLPLRNVAKLAGLNVDYDANTKTAVLNNKMALASEGKSWQEYYADIIYSISDKWDYNVPTKFGFVYLNDDDIPELVFGESSLSVRIYTFDTTINRPVLLAIGTTGARGDTNITYVEKENVILEQSGGTLFESEYEDKEGCIGSMGTWGRIRDLSTGKELDWSKMVFYFDENDSSKDVVESHISDEAKAYLDRAKEFDLKYTKEEAMDYMLEYNMTKDNPPKSLAERTEEYNKFINGIQVGNHLETSFDEGFIDSEHYVSNATLKQENDSYVLSLTVSTPKMFLDAEVEGVLSNLKTADSAKIEEYTFYKNPALLKSNCNSDLSKDYDKLIDNYDKKGLVKMLALDKDGYLCYFFPEANDNKNYVVAELSVVEAAGFVEMTPLKTIDVVLYGNDRIVITSTSEDNLEMTVNEFFNKATNKVVEEASNAEGYVYDLNDIGDPQELYGGYCDAVSFENGKIIVNYKNGGK